MTGEETAWAIIWSVARAHRYRLAAGVGLILIGRAGSLCAAFIVKLAVTHFLANQRTVPVMACVGMAAVTVIQAVADFLSAQLLGVEAERAVSRLRRDVQARVFRLPLRHLNGHRAGSLVTQIMTDAESIHSFVGRDFAELASGLMTLAMGALLLAYLNVKLTGALLVVALPFAIGWGLAIKRLHHVHQDLRIVRSDIAGRLAEALTGVMLVKACCAEGREARRFRRAVDTLLRRTIDGVAWSASISAGIQVAVGLLTATVLYVGARDVIRGVMSVAELTAYGFVVALTVLSLESAMFASTRLSEGVAGLRRIRGLLKEPQEELDAGRTLAVADVNAGIRFECVSFGYTATRYVLKNISFQVPAGTTTAIVGRSGSGKTTLTNLLLRFYDPQQGRILVDGVDIAAVTLRSHRARVATMLQEECLFDGTILDNIRYSRPGATINEVEQAAAKARCEAFVRKLPLGLLTRVGEHATTLSGGERQRVAIARAILAQRPLLVLDEATARLDAENEEEVQAALDALRGSVTTLVVAHRLSTILSSDQIVVLEDGNVVQCGSHSELMAAGGEYRRLFELAVFADVTPA